MTAAALPLLWLAVVLVYGWRCAQRDIARDKAVAESLARLRASIEQMTRDFEDLAMQVTLATSAAARLSLTLGKRPATERDFRLAMARDRGPAPLAFHPDAFSLVWPPLRPATDFGVRITDGVRRCGPVNLRGSFDDGTKVTTHGQERVLSQADVDRVKAAAARRPKEDN